MECNNVILIKNSARSVIEDKPREFVNEVLKNLSCSYNDTIPNTLRVGDVSIGTINKPIHANEHVLYMQYNGEMVEFNPFDPSFKDRFGITNKEVLNEVFSHIRTIYNKVLELNNEDIDLGIKEEDFNPESILKIKIDKQSPYRGGSDFDPDAILQQYRSQNSKDQES